MKALIKKIILKIPGSKRALVMRRKRLYADDSVANASSLQEAFTSIYEKNLWGNEESVSGAGSTLEYTENIRRELPPLLKRLGIKSILDAPCGDFNWFKLIHHSVEYQYIGGDIVEELIQQNTEEYGSDMRSFRVLDITTDPLPDADIWLCRDVLFHLCEEEVFKVFKNYLRSNIPQILISCHPNCTVNTDIPNGLFRIQNFILPPYSLPEPIDRIDDFTPEHADRYLGLWTQEQVRDAMAQNKRFQRV